MPASTPPQLPDFEAPPLVEVVCGVQFNELSGLKIPHIGLYWSKIKDEFPVCHEVQPLPPRIETYDQPQGMSINFSNVPPLPRLWLTQEPGKSVVQLQRDQFLYNWKKASLEDAYPRYAQVYSKFSSKFREFSSWCEEAEVGDVIPIQYELNYVNQFRLYDAPLGSVLPTALTGDWLRSDSYAGGQVSFVLPEKRGRLYITVQEIMAPIPGGTMERACRLELAARGWPGDVSEASRDAWFALAREWIVRGFADITSQELQEKKWRRKQ